MLTALLCALHICFRLLKAYTNSACSFRAVQTNNWSFFFCPHHEFSFSLYGRMAGKRRWNGLKRRSGSPMPMLTNFHFQVWSMLVCHRWEVAVWKSGLMGNSLWILYYNTWASRLTSFLDISSCRLQELTSNTGEFNEIQALKKQIWFAEVEVVNTIPLFTLISKGTNRILLYFS